VSWRIRSGLDSDSDGIIALIAACWAPYPGVLMDVDGEMPELRAPASYYRDVLWVAEQDHRVVGMIATRPLPEAGTWEICRVYVDPSLHGQHLGHDLLDVAETYAIAHGATRLMLWSDTRFARAHAFYEKRCYVRSGPIRVLHDISNSLEYCYAKPVDGFEILDAAAAGAAERRLADLLIACVDSGATVTFLPPLHMDKARAFWRRVSTEVGQGTRVVMAGWQHGELVATGMLDLATPENQPHCAAVQKVLVHPSARRSGLGRALMRAIERHAVTLGRPLLTLDTRAGDAGEALYRAEGWHETGRIPQHAVGPSGALHDTVYFWKRVV
jgi:GNAT superfamily N-acetyltransferase